MPAAAEVELRVLLLDDRDDVGMTGQGLDEGIEVELAEARRERLLLCRSDALIAEEDHLVLEPSAVDLLEGRVVDALGEIDPRDLGAEGTAAA